MQFREGGTAESISASRPASVETSDQARYFNSMPGENRPRSRAATAGTAALLTAAAAVILVPMLMPLLRIGVSLPPAVFITAPVVGIVAGVISYLTSRSALRALGWAAVTATVVAAAISVTLTLPGIGA